MSQNQHWVGTWTASPAPSEAGYGLNNQTIRMNPRVSLGGDTIRVRVSNAYGTRPLVLGGGTVGLRGKGPGVVPGSLRELSFNGAAVATIAAGAVLVSDPVSLEVPALADLAVSIHFPGEITPAFAITGRYARQTNYISPPGNVAGETVMPVGKITDEWISSSAGSMSPRRARDRRGGLRSATSLTDANISTHDAFCRWPDQLARRFAERRGGRPMAVMNQGLGGNRILHDLRGDGGLKRFDRDVLAQPGVTHCDRHARHQRPPQPATPQARGGGDRRKADDRRDRTRWRCGRRPGGSSSSPRRADPVRQRDLYGERLEPGARDATASRSTPGSARATASTASPISDAARSATRRSRPRWRARSTIAATSLHPSDLGYCKLGATRSTSALFE